MTTTTPTDIAAAESALGGDYSLSNTPARVASAIAAAREGERAWAANELRAELEGLGLLRQHSELATVIACIRAGRAT